MNQEQEKLVRATVNNTVLLGKDIRELKDKLRVLENNQNTLQQNMIWLGNKIDSVIEMLENTK